MSAETKDVERILQFKFRSPTADTSQLVALIKSAMPFYQASGVTHARLLRNVDDPSQFIQVLEYKVPEMLEMNRQAIAGRCTRTQWLDPMRGRSKSNVTS